MYTLGEGNNDSNRLEASCSEQNETEYSVGDHSDSVGISRLDSQSVSLLRAGVRIPSTQDVVMSLIKISLGLGADSISTSVDLESGLICVNDNGVGISREVVNAIGRFTTQFKLSNQGSQTTGLNFLSIHQKQLLDSLAHLSLLDICTREAKANYTHQTLFRVQLSAMYDVSQFPLAHLDGKILFSGPAKTSKRHCHGTTVTVRDLFYNLPVRRTPQVKKTFQLQRLKRQWEDCRKSIQNLAIAYPSVTFALRHSTHLSTLSESSSHPNFYQISKTGDPVLSFRKVFGPKFARDKVCLDSTSDHFTIDGFVSLHSCFDKSAQLIYLNRTLIPKSSEFYKRINNLLSQCFIARQFSFSLDESSTELESSTQNNSHFKNSTVSRPQQPVYLLVFKSLNKGTNAEFIENSLIVGDEGYLIPRVEEELVDFATRTITAEFEKADLKKSELQSFNISKSDYSPESAYAGVNFSEAKKNRSQKGSKFDVLVPTKLIKVHSSDFVTSRKRKKYCNSVEGSLGSHSLTSSITCDNLSGKLCENSQKIPAFPKNDNVEVKAKNLLDCNNLRKSTKFLNPATAERPKYPNWLKKGLNNYSSPVFITKTRECFKKLPENLQLSRRYSNLVHDQRNGLENLKKYSFKHIKNTSSFSSQLIESSFGAKNKNYNKFNFDQAVLDANDCIDLSKLARGSYRLIGQLNRQFILVLLRRDFIVAFDQHAVHERIRVENYFQLLFSKDLTLKKVREKNFEVTVANINDNSNTSCGGIPILVDRVEYEGFCRWKNSFRRWGFVYELGLASEEQEDEQFNRNEADSDKEKDFYQIVLFTVPELISSRTDRDFNLLSTVLRSCLSFFEDEVYDDFEKIVQCENEGEEAEVSTGGEDWLRQLRKCPNVLIDLINSKACRGAIMFGDELKEEDSHRLLKELSKTKLPFQCAHGRPTCYPLLKNRFKVDETIEDLREYLRDFSRPIDWEKFLIEEETQA